MTHCLVLSCLSVQKCVPKIWWYCLIENQAQMVRNATLVWTVICTQSERTTQTNVLVPCSSFWFLLYKQSGMLVSLDMFQAFLFTSCLLSTSPQLFFRVSCFLVPYGLLESWIVLLVISLFCVKLSLSEAKLLNIVAFIN